ncbi:MAG: lamin tail domain-containing protein [Chloroflexi bacterium]|nr:MAG: lamin tail domain-containing protein [Chloroflexota bacterium]
MVMTFMPLGQPAAAVSTTVVISQVYGGGGNAGATFKNDFIELFNRGATTLNLTGWSVQYGSATGSTWSPTPLSGTIQPGQYYLVQEAPGAGGSVNLSRWAPRAPATPHRRCTSARATTRRRSRRHRL